MEEAIFFEDPNIKVTNKRFISFGKTYALAAISSFRTDSVDEVKPREIYKLIVFGLVLLALIQILMMAEEKGGSIILLSFTAIAIVGAFRWGKGGKIKYILLLTTSAGEIEALQSYIPGYIERIEGALGQAIVSRN